jgi:hypothetical protein
MQVGQETSVTAVLVAGAGATILLWLLAYFAPGLMATAPASIENALGVIITAAICYVLPAWGARAPTAKPPTPPEVL